MRPRPGLAGAPQRWIKTSWAGESSPAQQTYLPVPAPVPAPAPDDAPPPDELGIFVGAVLASPAPPLLLPVAASLPIPDDPVEPGELVPGTPPFPPAPVPPPAPAPPVPAAPPAAPPPAAAITADSGAPTKTSARAKFRGLFNISNSSCHRALARPVGERIGRLFVFLPSRFKSKTSVRRSKDRPAYRLCRHYEMPALAVGRLRREARCRSVAGRGTDGLRRAAQADGSPPPVIVGPDRAISSASLA